MKKAFLLLLGLALGAHVLSAKKIMLRLQPVFGQVKLASGQPFSTAHNGDSVRIDELSFYLSAIKFKLNDTVVFAPVNDVHLISIHDSASLTITYEVPETMHWNAITFQLGIDSMTNITGAHGGELDPARGMYWAWQSGYINVKLEGTSAQCPTRNHRYQFHLGGYSAPYTTLQQIKLNVPEQNCITVAIEIHRFFEAVNLTQMHTVMSPSQQAVELSGMFANLFSLQP